MTKGLADGDSRTHKIADVTGNREVLSLLTHIPNQNMQVREKREVVV